MKLFLDTNVVSKIIRGREPTVRARFRTAVQNGHSMSISVIVLHELLYGARRGAEPAKNIERINDFTSSMESIEAFTAADAEIAGTLRAELARAGLPIGPYDLLIAAQALRIDTTVVTGNTRKFGRVRGLNHIDWTSP